MMKIAIILLAAFAALIWLRTKAKNDTGEKKKVGRMKMISDLLKRCFENEKQAKACTPTGMS